MSAAQHFKKAFSCASLNQLYTDKIQFRASSGMDNVSPKLFEETLTESIQTISRKVLAGTYTFTRYREILISKGRGKEPRVISIPTIRDKLALASYHSFLKIVFSDRIEEPLLHTVIGNISEVVLSGKYDGYVKVDIKGFYSSIDHSILLKKIKRKIRKPEAIAFLKGAIETQTIPRNTKIRDRNRRAIGVPEGLSISNILADIYLSDLKELICDKYDIDFFRYVDDILILCKASKAFEIKDYINTNGFEIFAIHSNYTVLLASTKKVRYNYVNVNTHH